LGRLRLRGGHRSGKILRPGQPRHPDGAGGETGPKPGRNANIKLVFQRITRMQASSGNTPCRRQSNQPILTIRMVCKWGAS
jgi:hypothetical protein